MGDPDASRWLEMSLGNDGIVTLRWKPGAEVTLPLARASIEAMSSLTGGKKSPLLVDMAAIRFITRDARELYVSESVSSLVSAVALVVGSPLTMTFANFYLRVNKPPIPTRMFESESAALQWLERTERRTV